VDGPADVIVAFVRSSGELAQRLVDVKVAAIDEDWSGLRVVWRVENREKG
jgi:hypothetical protein